VNVTVGEAPASDSIGVEVLEPSAVRIVQAPGTFKWHDHNTASVGFKGVFIHTPDTVSFWKVQFKEGGGKGEGKGYFNVYDGLEHPIGKAWRDVQKGISPLTQRPNTTISRDTIGSDSPFDSPYSDGSFLWPIQRLFKCGTHEGRVCIVNHQHFITASGDVTVSKGGTTKSAKYGDRDSSYETGPDQ
jgi:hypothetical protein